MNPKIVLVLVSMLALASSQLPSSSSAVPGPPAVNPWIPPWVSSAPWYPQWGPCDVIGASCLDCTTKLVCTKIGGLQKVCADPASPYCNLGECSSTPTVECAPTEDPTTTSSV